ncbi:MAG: TetR/AcrR family transcriptional regulator [Polyangiaceae bacterium]
MPQKPRPEPRKLPRQERSRALVDAILTATADLLEQQGPAFTLAEVGARAGVGSGSLYQYFPDRQTLIAALIDRQLSHDRAALEAFRTAPAQPLSALPELLVQGMLALYAERPRAMTHMVALLHELGRHAEVQALSQEFCEALTLRLQAAQPGASPAACRDAAQSAVFALLGVVRQVALDAPERLATDADVRARLCAVARAALNVEAVSPAV